MAVYNLKAIVLITFRTNLLNMQRERLKLEPDTWMIKEIIFLWRQNDETVFWKNGEVIVRIKTNKKQNLPQNKQNAYKCFYNNQKLHHWRKPIPLPTGNDIYETSLKLGMVHLAELSL